MKITATAIAEVLEIEPRVHADERGHFLESWSAARFAEAGLELRFVQDNRSLSRRGTLRGLHYQLERPQGKLIQVVRGEIFDVAVDLRRSSATFGRRVESHLSADEPKLLWIPPGFAHGIYVPSEEALLLYKCTDYYAPETQRSIRWDDPDLAIDWPLVDGRPPLLSERDRLAVAFGDAECFE